MHESSGISTRLNQQQKHIAVLVATTAWKADLVTPVVLFWLIKTTTKPPYSEPLTDLVNCTATEIMESYTQCHYNYIGLAQITWI